MISAKKSKPYNRFIAERNAALEKILNKHIAITNDLLRKFLTEITTTLVSQYAGLSGKTLTSAQLRVSLDHIRAALSNDANLIAKAMAGNSFKLSRVTYLLAKAGEAEAIGRATGKPTKASLSATELLDQSTVNANEEPHFDRIYLALIRILDKSLHSFMRSIVSKHTTEEMRDNLLKTFPKARKVEKPKRVIKPLKEADQDQVNKFGFGIVDEVVWDEVISDYVEEYVPEWRGPESVYDVDVGEPELEERYGWEIEKQITHDFVKDVRDGQVAAANENGIKDFVWIAVLDDRTCDSCCGDYGCSDFDGKLTSEVEEMTGGETIAPPAHFNCRCDLAPYLEEMGDISDNQLGDFETWLT